MRTTPKTNNDSKLMEKVTALCKRRGFIFPGSEIYGGLANSWDYGPYGVELKNNIKRVWWESNVYLRNDIYGMDAAIIMHPKTWEASGHVKNFSDPVIKCSACGALIRSDKVWDEIWNSPWILSLRETLSGEKDSSYLLRWAKHEGKKLSPNLSLVKDPEVTMSWMADLHHTFHGVDLDFKNFVGMIACSSAGVPKTPCPICGNALPDTCTSVNLMLETYLGPVKETAEQVFLRPETAQGMFVNFANILDSRHPKLPFGLAQIGKSFRNEITPGNFTFRTREFEQMEIEYFCRPEDSDKIYEEWVEIRKKWYLDLGIKPENIRFRRHAEDELAHYAKACTDVEYFFPWGWSELEGIANRADFDLKRHAEYSGRDLTYFDAVEKKRFFPHIIEPSGGVDRCLLAFLTDAYHEEQVKEDTRVVLRLSAKLAPVKAAVLPLLKNRDEIVGIAKKLSGELKKKMNAVYDDTANIGKLYRRQDEVGTLFCVTVDMETLEDKQVTVRDRDSMQQVRIPLENVEKYISDKL